MYVVFWLHVCEYTMYLPSDFEARREQRSSETGFKGLWDITWVLETEPWSSEKAANAINNRAIVPTPYNFLL